MCSIFLCPNGATHSYQCVQHFPVSKRRYPFLSVCAAFSCVQTMARLPVFGTFLLMYESAHGGCTDNVRVSALKADSGEQLPCCTRDSNPRQYCSWLLIRTLCQLNYRSSPRRERKFVQSCGPLALERSPRPSAVNHRVNHDVKCLTDLPANQVIITTNDV